MRRVSFSLSFPLVMVCSFAVLLLMYPQESSAAAQDGITICSSLIIPSLFPFFVLSSLLVSLGFAAILGDWMKPWMWPVFRLNGSCASALILGAIGGYPVGARTAAQLYEDRQCTKEDALRLSAFCNNCGPAFLFSVAGCGVFSSKTAGFLLLGTHIAAACLVGFFARFYSFKTETRVLPSNLRQKASFSAVFPDCVKDSFSATLNVCAFVILFSVLLRLSSCSGLLPWCAEHLARILPGSVSPELCHSLIAGIFELSTGIYTLTEVSSAPLALPLAAFLLGWGGLSVHCQSLPFLNRCVSSLAPYFAGKLLQGLLAALMTALLAPLFLSSGTPVAPPIHTMLIGSSAITLLHQEVMALWCLSGAYFLLTSWKKGLVKRRKLLYNRNSKH